MKKITLLFTCLLMLCGCNKSNKDDKDTRYYNEIKYAVVNKYEFVELFFDDYMRCVVDYENEETQESLHWVVYLKGCYIYDISRYATFYECKKLSSGYDYYLSQY